MVRLPLPGLPGADADGLERGGRAGEYLHVREYRPGDDAGRVDALRSSMRDTPYVRVADRADAADASVRPSVRGTPLVLDSDVALSPRSRARGSDLVRMGLVALAFVVIALQWESWLLSGLLLATIVAVALCERVLRGRHGGRFAQNTVMI